MSNKKDLWNAVVTIKEHCHGIGLLRSRKPEWKFTWKSFRTHGATPAESQVPVSETFLALTT